MPSAPFASLSPALQRATVTDAVIEMDTFGQRDITAADVAVWLEVPEADLIDVITAYDAVRPHLEAGGVR